MAAHRPVRETDLEMRSRQKEVDTVRQPRLAPRPNRMVPGLLIIGTLIVGFIAIFTLTINSDPTDLGPPEFRATLKDTTSTQEALAFLGEAAVGPGGIERVELNDEDRRLVVRFTGNIGDDTVACSIYRAAYEQDIFKDIEVTFSPFQCPIRGGSRSENSTSVDAPPSN